MADITQSLIKCRVLRNEILQVLIKKEENNKKHVKIYSFLREIVVLACNMPTHSIFIKRGEIMDIRKVNINDYKDVINLYKQLFDAEKVFDDNIVRTYKVDEKEEKRIKKRIKSRKEIFLIAEIDNKIVGLIDGYIIESIYYKEKISYLDHLCVDEKFRNNEIGSKLIERFSEISKKKGASYIKLNAFEKNIPAVNLYNKHGFESYSIYYMKKI